MSLLQRYIALTTFRALVLVSLGLTCLFSLLEFIEQLHDVGKGHYRLIDAGVFVLLTAPARLLQLMPAAMLFACLFALGTLAARAELTVMRASGMSPGEIVGAVFKLAAGILVPLFLLAQFVIPAAQQRAQTERAARLSTVDAVRSGNSFWAAGEHRLLNVRRFADVNIPIDVYVYEFSEGSELQRSLQAARAEVQADGSWLLKGVTEKRFSGTRIETQRLDSLIWQSFLRPGQASLLTLPADSMQPLDLYRYVRDLERRHEPAARYSQELWAKIDLPLAIAAMILIAVPFAFGPTRSQGAGQRMLIGTLIGIVFSLIQQITTYLGQLLNVSPALTATAPSIALIALGFYLLRRALA